jgi:hypothetical protein
MSLLMSQRKGDWWVGIAASTPLDAGSVACPLLRDDTTRSSTLLYATGLTIGPADTSSLRPACGQSADLRSPLEHVATAVNHSVGPARSRIESIALRIAPAAAKAILASEALGSASLGYRLRE